MNDFMDKVDYMIKNGSTSAGNYGMDKLIDALFGLANPITFEISGDTVKITPNTPASMEYVNSLLLAANYACITIDGNSIILPIDDPIYLQLVLKYS